MFAYSPKIAIMGQETGLTEVRWVSVSAPASARCGVARRVASGKLTVHSQNKRQPFSIIMKTV